MRERGILMSAPMVRALLAGTKTQTRRIVKPGPAGVPDPIAGYVFNGYALVREEGSSLSVYPIKCPYGMPGDRLWVREAWQFSDWTEDGEPWIGYAACGGPILCRTFDEEWNDRLGDIWASLSDPNNYDIDNRAADRRWRPSIHMPRWASRITLEVTGVRVERLQDITPADSISEGIGFDVRFGGHCVGEGLHFHASDPRQSYFSLWDAINGKGSVAANPWCWVLEFRRVHAG